MAIVSTTLYQRGCSFAARRQAEKILSNQPRIKHYDSVLAAVLEHLSPGFFFRTASWQNIFLKKGIKSILELGCTGTWDFLRFLDQALPPEIKLTGLTYVAPDFSD